VVYNGANNEFVRTNTLAKGEIIQVDAAPFRLWYESYYGVPVGLKKKSGTTKKVTPKAIAKQTAAKDARAAAKAAAAAKEAKAAPTKEAKAAPAKDDKSKPTTTAKDAKAAAPAAEEKDAKVAAKGAKDAGARRVSTKVSTKEGGIKTTKSALERYRRRSGKRSIDPLFEEQFSTGYLLAAIASRPGQTGRVDGYLLEGKELEFYLKKTQKKKSQK